MTGYKLQVHIQIKLYFKGQNEYIFVFVQNTFLSHVNNILERSKYVYYFRLKEIPILTTHFSHISHMNVINWLIHTSYNHVWHFSESWGEWSSWSQCSEQCLPGESQARTRLCLRSDGEPSEDLTNCKVTEVTKIQFKLSKNNNHSLQGGPSNIEMQRCICPSYIETAVSTNNTSGKYYFKYR